MADASLPDPEPEPEEEGDQVKIITTEQETEGFLIIKAIVRDIIRPSRIFMRDQQSYCGILVDNNNRKPLARLHFNRTIKYIGTFDSGKEQRAKIDTLDNIYDYAEQLRRTAGEYASGAEPLADQSVAPPIS